MAARESDKGQRYVAALDAARCQNRWDELPELIRKVTKHAPQKKCLLEVVSAEYQVVTHSHNSDSSASTSSLPELIPSLLSTIEKGEGSEQDIFQAQTCLGWVHWTLNEPGLTVARLPKDFNETLNNLNAEALSPWTLVCLVKACYLKGASQNILSGAPDATETFNSLGPWLSGQIQDSSSSPQFLYWSEKVLAEGALLVGNEACAKIPAIDGGLVKSAMSLFRLWSSHPYVKSGTSSHGQHVDGGVESNSQALIWKFYYDLLSAFLKYDLEYPALTPGPERPQLSSEIRRVESLYESSLLREEKFPTANTQNARIENWVEQVIQNWEVLCGTQWSDEDLGEGGQNAVGRNVLDILYRAATKTYHSYLILRRLFHVHLTLADFPLALKALDSYIEIVINAKERAEKAAQYGDLENDGVLLRTLSEGVIMLCCFGSDKDAEKARDLTSLMKTFIDKHVQDTEGDDQEGGRLLISAEANSTRSQAVSPSDLAAAYRGVGIGLANWAHWTPVNENRDDIRNEAIEYLEKSIAPELEDENNYSSIYTLALLLAESRDVDDAIDYVKSALTTTDHPGAAEGTFARERDLVSLWHLLALLLSAKHDFEIAERSCEAAFEQFPSAVTSLAHRDRRPQKQQHSLGVSGLDHTLIDRLRGREKERIIETRISQLAFVELLEGPEAAVNHSHSLLGLFATLFGNLNLETDDKNVKSEHLVPPKSSAGTVKSLRGSIFGRNRGPRAEPAGDHKTGSTNPSFDQSESWVNTDAAPAIQVTDEDKHAHEHSQSVSRSDSKKLRKRSSTLKKSEASQEPNSNLINGDGGNSSYPDVNGIKTPQPTGEEADAQGEQSARLPLRPVAHNVDHTNQPPPIGHPNQPPQQDVRLSTSYGFDSPTRAVTKFPLAQAQTHALCILVKIWLLVAGLYRRAALFDDAREACEEAAKQVTRVEALTAAQDSSARSFRERNWGSPKSTDELWADYYAEQALLLKTQSRPHEAMEHFETALLRDPDHPKATIGLANFLLDVWDQKLPLEPPELELEVDLSILSLDPSGKKRRAKESKNESTSRATQKTAPPSPAQEEEPKLLNRIAARDRAFGLLSALTKRGSSWDNTEAWYALSRAYEATGQIEKLKEVLWWCIELEDRRPIRHWSNLGSGTYVL